MFEQYQKQIIITNTITTRYWVRIIQYKSNTISLDRKSEYEVWIKSLVIKSKSGSLVKSLDQKSRLSQPSDIKRL